MTTLIHSYLGIAIEVFMFITLYLFGLRISFRLGEIFGMFFSGVFLIGWLDIITGLSFAENFLHFGQSIEGSDTGETDNFKEFIPFIRLYE